MAFMYGTAMSHAVTVPPDISTESFINDMSEQIISVYEKPLLNKMIENDFSHLYPQQRREIYNKALKNATPSEFDALSMFHYSVRKALIESDVRKCLEDNKFFIPDGLVHFRLQDYKEELRRIYTAAADEVEAEKEYEEFLDMLKFFVSVQSPREQTVHIIKTQNGLRIKNRRHRDITDEYSREFIASGEQLTSDDIALSALIAIAPEKIIIHDNPSENRLYTTIERIFSDVVYR